MNPQGTPPLPPLLPQNRKKTSPGGGGGGGGGGAAAAMLGLEQIEAGGSLSLSLFKGFLIFHAVVWARLDMQILQKTIQTTNHPTTCFLSTLLFQDLFHLYPPLSQGFALS